MIEEVKEFTKRVDNFEKLKPSEQIDFFGHFLIYERKQEFFTASQIGEIFKCLRLIPYSNISGYLNLNSNKYKRKKQKIKFIKNKQGFKFLSSFEDEINLKIKDIEVPFMNFKVNSESLDYKPSDLPFLNSKIKKQSDFFSKLYYILYHLENSLRRFLTLRLQSILGNEWERKLIEQVDLAKAVSIRKETNLSEMLQDRGDSILFYCMWDDYGKILRNIANIIENQKESDEILAHLNSLTKIRNAIAHNTATIPQEYQEELTVFLKKYLKIMKKYNFKN